MKPPPSNIVVKINNSREQIRQAITALRHEEYGLNEIVNVTTEYNDKLCRLALLMHGHQLDEVMAKLSAVRHWITEASDLTHEGSE